MVSPAEFIVAAITMSLSNISGFAIFLQAIKIYQLKKVTAIAISPYFVMFITNTFWLLYGIFRNDVVLIIPCVIWMVSLSTTIIIYYYYLKNRLSKR